jgi:hypothetical protein
VITSARHAQINSKTVKSRNAFLQKQELEQTNPFSKSKYEVRTFGDKFTELCIIEIHRGIIFASFQVNSFDPKTYLWCSLAQAYELKNFYVV